MNFGTPSPWKRLAEYRLRGSSLIPLAFGGGGGCLEQRPDERLIVVWLLFNALVPRLCGTIDIALQGKDLGERGIDVADESFV